MVEMSVETKLAPSSPVHTMMSIGRDLENGEVYAEEYGKQIKGQMSLDFARTPAGRVQQIDGDTVDTQTGEIGNDQKSNGVSCKPWRGACA